MPVTFGTGYLDTDHLGTLVLDGTGPTLAEFAAARLLYSVRAGPNARALVSIFANRVDGLLSVIDACKSAYALDLAEGAQLDVLGRVLGQPRLGLSDARYRRVLQAQAVVILSSSATESAIASIVEIFTGSPAVEITEHPPLGFHVAANVTPADATLLASLINRARAAAYRVHLAVIDGDTLIADTHDEAEADPGTVDTQDEDQLALGLAYPTTVLIPA